MTSPANPPKTNQAPTTAAASVNSYASAAGASKPAIVASGSHPSLPVAVGSSTSTATSNARSSQLEPANGATRDHTRKNSLTIAPNGPSSTYGTNGGPVGGPKAHNLQFHYSSPHTTYNTPQPSHSAPIPIPNTGNNRVVASPAQSPSPIPQPTASGGRPPSSLIPDAKPVFGSLPSDQERKGQPTNPAIQNAQNVHHHNRQGSNISMSSTGDIPGQNMQHQGRGNYHGGRGGGRGQPFNPHTNFNPNGSFQQGGFGTGNGRGRGGMPPPFNPGGPGPRPVQPFNNSPQPSRASPHHGPSHPGTPQMGAAMPVPPQQAGNFGYPPMAQQNITGFPPFQQGPQYAPPMGHMAPPMGYMPGMGYNNTPMNPYGGQPNPPAYPPQYAGAPTFHPGTPNMSRTPSNTEKPGTPAGHATPPVIVGNQQHQQAKAAPFVKPRKSAAIPIKRPEGGEVDVKSLTTPASPASSLQPSKTPPIATSSSTPPTKPSTPAHGRSDSHAPQKSAKEVQEELRAKIAQATKSSADKEEEARVAAEKAAAEKAAAEKAAAEAKEKAEAEAKAKKEAEEKAAEEARLEAERKAKEEEEEAKRRAEEEAAAKAAEEAERKKREEEEEMERMIAEMEEEDRRREEEQAKITAEKEATKAAEKAEADKRRAAEAAENDRKLREQEREMERLEEEKSKKAKDNAAAGLSVAELLAQSKTGVPPPETKVDVVADKLGAMTIGSGDSKPSTPTSATGSKPSDKQPRKPAALNLSVSTKNIEAPQPSAALTSLKTSRFLTIKESLDPSLYAGLASPNPALNAAVGKRGQAFKYDAQFLLQFQKVFTEQPSVEFTTQVKQLIGDNDGSRSAQARTPATAGGRQNSRTNSGFPGNMASFGNFSNQARTLPPGTTSESRFAQSTANMGRPPMGSGMSFGPGVGSFPRGNLGGQMVRQPSNQGMGPNSPRQGSRAGRGGSQKSGFNTKESKDAKAMPLTQGQEVKALTTTSTGWKPMSVVGKGTQQAGGISYMDPEMVQRKVKAALNKMTPENFDRISEQILQIANQSKQEKDGRTLRQVIQLTFEKATDEPHFSSTYAKFCKRMLDQMSNDIKDDTILDKHGQVVSGGNLFRKYLLNRCQEEFEKGWSVPNATDDKQEGPAALMSDEYYENAAVKRRGLGLVRFIGELYKLGMLTERIITGCIHGLIDYKDEPKEAEIESLCFLMRTVGQQLEATEKSQPVMQVYFERIQKMIDLPNLDNRLKFMLMDVRDLRNNGWQSKEANKGPKTLEEIRAESQAAALAKQQEAAARSSSRGGIGGGRGGGGRGDGRTFSAGYNNQASNTVGMDDLRRLKSGSRPTGAMTLGPHSMLASRSNSGRRGGPGGLGRTGEDSGMSSRTSTPPTHSASHSNAYGLLANLDAENPASPPSTAASPSMAKVNLDTSTEKKD